MIFIFFIDSSSLNAQNSATGSETRSFGSITAQKIEISSEKDNLVKITAENQIYGSEIRIIVEITAQKIVISSEKDNLVKITAENQISKQ
ncbi:hypothetical protein [Butyrivibrio sp. VCD2006]|uniref:hypothetical protein n=1 Tax=Butyrivibrio sp. VCD2006 TaxID=1280664 RepID=UPI000423058A|nr:hypothetical protein [Butyrivibrio sp. VCD2006]